MQFVNRYDISDEALDLLQKMLKYNSETRMNASQCL